MSTPHTVLVVGAGAHAPYGLPTGPELKEDLVHRLTLGNDPEFCELIQQTTSQTLPFDDFAQILRHSVEPTVDDVLADADDRFRLVCNAAISVILFERERQAGHLRPEDDWITKVLRRIVVRAEGPDDGVAVITFNYDRLFEYRAIGYALSKRGRRGTPPNSIECPIRVEHVHGSLCPPLSRAHLLQGHFELNFANPTNIMAAARGIRVMPEDHDPNQRSLLAGWIQQAERVLFLGFGFHDMNLAALGIVADVKHPAPRGKWASTCVNLSDDRRKLLGAQTGLDFGFQPAHSLSALLDVVPRMTGTTAGW